MTQLCITQDSRKRSARLSCQKSGGNNKQCSSNSAQSCLYETLGDEHHLLGILPASSCVLLVSPSSSVSFYELPVLTLILTDQWSESHVIIYSPREGKYRSSTQTPAARTHTGYTQHEHSFTGLRAAPRAGGSSWLAENANGGRALLTGLPSILQIVQEFEPLTFTSSHKPASLTCGKLLTIHFPFNATFKINFLSLSSLVSSLSSLQPTLYIKEVTIRAVDPQWVGPYEQLEWGKALWTVKEGNNSVVSLSLRLTHVRRGQWSTGSSGFGCRASAACSPGTLSSGSLQTCCLCGRWLAASCRAHVTASDFGPESSEPSR